VAAAALGLFAVAVLALAGGRPDVDRASNAELPALARDAAGPAAGGETSSPAVDPPASVPLEATAAALPIVPVSDDLPQSPKAPREGTEAAHYQRYLALGLRRDGSLSPAAERVFAGEAPANERVALLRALWDSGAPDAPRWFTAALTAPGERAASQAAVPDFAVRFLAERVRQLGARRILTEYLAAAPEDCHAGRLERAAAALDESRTIVPDEEP